MAPNLISLKKKVRGFFTYLQRSALGYNNVFIIVSFFCLFILALFVVSYKGNSYAGAQSDYLKYWRPLFEFIAENRKLPVATEYTVSTYPLIPIVYGTLLGLFGSENILFLVQFGSSLVSIYLVWKLAGLVKGSTAITRSSFLALFVFSTYFTSGTLNPTSDVPALALTLGAIYFFYKVRFGEEKAKVTSDLVVLNIILVALLLSRQIYGWLLIWVWINEIQRLKINLFLRMYWISIASSLLSASLALHYFGGLTPQWYEQSSAISIPTLMNVGVIAFLASVYFFSLIFTKDNVRFLSSHRGIVCVAASAVFGNLLLKSNEFIAFPYGPTFLWSKLGHFDKIAPIMSFIALILIGRSLEIFKASQFSVALYWYLFLISSLIISYPFVRYFEFPIFIGALVIGLFASKDLKNYQVSIHIAAIIQTSKFFFILL